ncbi:MAG: ribosome maturation factor RimM [Gammaproteobacteria bacterium]|nr:ribosome maturation factor RimM [Gammaproteobacteria bacterium]MCP5135617.1 ribosome maturation factor RimM [Gammaproteobacteria bacterium]
MLELGRISGLHGVRGWVKVFSYTEPRENIVHYPVWQIRIGNEWRALKVEDGQANGRGVIAKLAGIDDRDAAASLVEATIAIPRDQLPPLPEGEYYWVDMEGLRVVNLEGVELGKVTHLFDTGANEVLVVQGDRERLIPFTIGDEDGYAVKRVDREAGLIEVDWDPEF